MKPFLCPSCNQPLASEHRPAVAPNPYVILWCPNPRCPSDVAQWDGGSGPTAEAAYRSLCAAVDHEIESEIDLEAKKERDKEIMAERLGDRLDRGQ